MQMPWQWGNLDSGLLLCYQLAREHFNISEFGTTIFKSLPWMLPISIWSGISPHLIPNSLPTLMVHIIQPCLFLNRFPVSLSPIHPRLTQRTLETSLIRQTAQHHGAWGTVGPWWCQRQRSHSSQSPWPQKLQTKPQTHTGSDTRRGEHPGAKHSPLIGGKLLTVTSWKEHQNVGILESIAHLQGESKPVLEIFTLTGEGSSN